MFAVVLVVAVAASIFSAATAAAIDPTIFIQFQFRFALSIPIVRDEAMASKQVEEV